MPTKARKPAGKRASKKSPKAKQSNGRKPYGGKVRLYTYVTQQVKDEFTDVAAADDRSDSQMLRHLVEGAIRKYNKRKSR